MTPDDWAELMEGEENHGRTRGGEGGWHSLDYGTMASLEEHYEYIVHVPIHGTRSAYAEGCKCDACRRAEREYRREYNARVSKEVSRQRGVDAPVRPQDGS